MLVLLFDNLIMALCIFLIGLYFYRSKGKAADYLTGYNLRSEARYRHWTSLAGLVCTFYSIAGQESKSEKVKNIFRTEYDYGKIKPRDRKDHVRAFWKGQCNRFGNYRE